LPFPCRGVCFESVCHSSKLDAVVP
jgi:hypothetical protein